MERVLTRYLVNLGDRAVLRDHARGHRLPFVGLRELRDALLRALDESPVHPFSLLCQVFADLVAGQRAPTGWFSSCASSSSRSSGQVSLCAELVSAFQCAARLRPTTTVARPGSLASTRSRSLVSMKLHMNWCCSMRGERRFIEWKPSRLPTG